MSFKIIGSIKVLGETKQFSAKFSKRDLVLTDSESMYPQDILFQFSQDKCQILDMYKEGEIVEISFNLRGREWANPESGEIKYFNTLDAWRIEKTQPNEVNNHKAENSTLNTNREKPAQGN